MKKRILLLCAIPLFFTVGSFAQYTERIQDTSVFVQWDLNVKTAFEEDVKNLQRFKKDMEKFGEYNQIPDSVNCDMLFIGSSSFRKWGTVKYDMAPAKVINRAFGGSMVRNLLYSYDVVIKPMHPKKIVLYVENDLPSKKYPIQVYKTFDFFRILCTKMHTDFPDVPIYILSLKPSPSRADIWSSVSVLNTLLKEYCQINKGFKYVDVASAMVDEKGAVFTDIFVQDNLHMNAKGYEIWKQVLRDQVMGDCNCGEDLE